MQKKTRLIVISAVAIVTIAAAAFGFYMYFRTAEYNKIIAAANESMKDENYQKAISQFKEALNYRKGADVENNIKLAESLEKDKNIYDEALALMESKRYSNAIEMLNKVSRNNGKLFKSSQDKIRESIEALNEQNIQKASDALKNKGYEEALKYVDEILKFDDDNESVKKLKDTILMEKAKYSVSLLMDNGKKPDYEEKESTIDGKEYYIFYEMMSNGDYTDRRFCVDKNNGKIYIQISDGRFMTVEEHDEMLAEAERKEKEAEAAAKALARYVQKIGTANIRLTNVRYSSQFNMSEADFVVTTDEGAEDMYGGFYNLVFYDENDNIIGKADTGNNCVVPGSYETHVAQVFGADIRNYSYFMIEVISIVHYPVPKSIWD